MSDHPKEHGLLFKPDMVRAYFAKIKSQTRRVITRQNSYIDGGPAYENIWSELQFDRAWVDPGPLPAGNAGPYLKVPRVEKKNGKVVDEYVHRVYQRYQVGDTIWGREAWRVGAWDENNYRVAIDYKADGYCRREWLEVPDENVFGRLWQQSTDDARKACGIQDSYKWKPGESPCRWRPSIFLPRWAARIVTPIVASRPERLVEISQEDAESEGCPGWYQPATCICGEIDGPDGRTPREEFMELWNSINKDRGYGYGESSWHGWTWVIEFERYKESKSDSVP